MIFVEILSILLPVAAALLCARRAVHLLQLESYQLDGYDRARKRNRGTGRDGLIVWCILLALGIACALILRRLWAPVLPPSSSGVISTYTYNTAGAVGIIGGADGLTTIFVVGNPVLGVRNILTLLSAPLALLVVWLRGRRRPAKKPLAFTKRVKRLFLVLAAVNLLVGVAAWLVSSAYGFILSLTVQLLLQPWLLKLAARCAQPMEKAINNGFFRDAQRILRERTELIKIGITGSYGKTSTKFILAGILGEKYNVLATPSSFNTPMGLTRVIREQLRPEHEVFIAEMGARHVGDIAELVELVHPTLGMITSIGPQHLETFHSIENVCNTKYELIEGLPEDGVAFFGDDGGLCASLYARGRKGKKVLAGLGEGEGVRALDIAVGPQGSTFTLRTPQGDTMAMTTRLLGAHNIQNIALCCALALELGLTLEQIAAGVAKVAPVEHRLQLIQGAGGNIVIDDAFNSNPAGANAAMEVLAAFPGRRIVITPGMVELGEQEAELNRAFGRKMATAADIAILIGPRRTQPIAQGLREAGFNESGLLVVQTLEEATLWLATNSRPGDVVLFENDLPDNYSE